MTTTGDVVDGADRCYRAVLGKDARFDGVFFTGVRTTGIYCRPSCPAMTPRRTNVAFYRTAAAAQRAGFRACRRCRPDTTPGSPQWDVHADLAGRAMRMIADGVVDREGVGGLAARTGYTPRHLGRVLSDQLGAGPLALARAQRAHTARILIETTDVRFVDIAFAAGFSSVRQFNDTVRQVYGAPPSALRASGRGRQHRGSPAGTIAVSLALRQPFDAVSLLSFLQVRSVTGVEECDEQTYARTMRLPHGPARVRLTPGADRVACELDLSDLRDLSAAVERCRRLLDLDADPVVIDTQLAADDLLGPHLSKHPGLRVPGHVDGFELAVRAVVGQQVSVAAARGTAARLVTSYGEPVEATGGLTHLFPTADAIAAADPEDLPMPRSRGRALCALASAVVRGDLVLDRGADRAEVRQALVALPGVGPWTAGYIAMRALGDPDVFLSGDAGVRHGLTRLGATGAFEQDAASTRWSPWRSYALMHIWKIASERDS
jgi:AraC family transcriptional regulator of adaptative response / DNA-3-methyladenine glycosylase II